MCVNIIPPPLVPHLTAGYRDKNKIKSTLTDDAST